MTIEGTIKMNSQQYAQLGPDPLGVRLELVDGEIAVSPSPNSDHSYVALRLATVLNNHIFEHDLGRLYADLDTVFDDFNVRRPDLMFFSKDRLHLVQKGGVAEGVPDLAIEILSPSSRKMDRAGKFSLYEKHGVACYWIVDIEREAIDAFVLQSKKYVAVGPAGVGRGVGLPPFESLVIEGSRIWP